MVTSQGVNDAGCISYPVTIPVMQERWRCLGSAAVYRPANLTTETGQECSICFSGSLRHHSVFQQRTSWEQ